MKVRIDVEIYSMVVIVVTTFEEFKKLHKSAEKEDFNVTARYGQYIYVLVTDEWDNMYDYSFIRCMSHELNHAAMRTLERSGVKLDYDNQEALCYLQDYLMAKFFKVVNKLDKKL